MTRPEVAALIRKGSELVQESRTCYLIDGGAGTYCGCADGMILAGFYESAAEARKALNERDAYMDPLVFIADKTGVALELVEEIERKHIHVHGLSALEICEWLEGEGI